MTRTVRADLLARWGRRIGLWTLTLAVLTSLNATMQMFLPALPFLLEALVRRRRSAGLRHRGFIFLVRPPEPDRGPTFASLVCISVLHMSHSSVLKRW